MSSVDKVVYQVVTPGEPEQKARCCLNGVGGGVVLVVIVEMVLSASESLIDSEVVGPLAPGGLELDISVGTRKKNLRHTLIHETYQPITAV